MIFYSIISTNEKNSSIIFKKILESYKSETSFQNFMAVVTEIIGHGK